MKEPEYVIKPVIIRRDLIPPFVLDECHRGFTIGAEKHKGKSADPFTHETIDELIVHIENHLNAIKRGQKIDPEGFYNAAAGADRFMQIIYLQMTNKEG